jgi:translation initiation factor 2B subunit (eIF-2B alpha/beta/delta family)
MKTIIITDDPTVSDFLGVKIDRDIEVKMYTLTQPHLIKSIITDLGLKFENAKTREHQHSLQRY